MGKKKELTKVEARDRLDRITWQAKSVADAKSEEQERFHDFYDKFTGKAYKKLHIPKIYTHIWVAISEFINDVLLSPFLYRVFPWGFGENREEAAIKQKVLNAEVIHIPDVRRILGLHFMQSLIGGWTTFKTGWVKEREGLLFPFLFNENILFDSNIMVGSNLKWIHQRIIKTRQEIEVLARNGTYKDVDPLFNSTSPLKKETYEGETSYLIAECWDEEEQNTVGLSNDGTATCIIRHRENPYKKFSYKFPYIIASPDLSLNNLKAMGMVEVLEDLNDEIDTNRRLRINALKLATVGQWLYKSHLLDEASVDFLRRGKTGYIPIKDDFDVLMRIPVGNIPPSAFMEDQLFSKEIEEPYGTYSQVRGAPAEKKQTLGEHLSLKMGGSRRLLSHLFLFCLGVEEIGKCMLQEILMHEPKGKIRRLVGKNMAEDEIKKAFKEKNAWEELDVTLATALFSDRENRERMLIKVLEVLKGSGLEVQTEEIIKQLLHTISPGIEETIFALDPALKARLDSLKRLPPFLQEEILRIGASAVSNPQVYQVIDTVLQRSKGGAESPEGMPPTGGMYGEK